MRTVRPIRFGVVDSSNDRRSSRRHDDPNIIPSAVISSPRLVADPPAVRQAGMQQIAVDLAVEHPVFEAGTGRIAQGFSKKHQVEVVDHRIQGAPGIALLSVGSMRSRRELASPIERA